MTVTLNFTSKGLIDAIQRQLAQQKSEGKISGDISYKNIATESFWDKIKEINDKRSSNKVFHGKSYSTADRGKNIDWTKTVVVYGSTTFSDEEWETLVHSMKLELTSKAKTEEPEKEHVVEETPKGESVPEEETEKFKPVRKEVMALLQHKLGNNGSIESRELLKAGYTFDIDNDELVCFDKQGNRIGFDEVLNIAKVISAKNSLTQDPVPETAVETDDENCTDDEEE